MSDRRRAAENLALGFLALIGFVGLMGLIGYFATPYEFKFQSDRTTVTYELPQSLWSCELCKQGQVLNLTVSVEAGAAVAIRTITLRSSIPGLSNVTLLSGGSIYWGQYLTYNPDKKAKESKTVPVAIPDSVKNAGIDSLRADIVVSYAYAMPSGSEFLNLFSEDTVPIEISLVAPVLTSEVIVMVAMVVVSISLGAFVIKDRIG